MCSDLDLFHIKVSNLKEFFKKKDYPADIMYSVLTKFINRKMAEQTLEPQKKTDDIRIKLYLILHYLSEKIDSLT